MIFIVLGHVPDNMNSELEVETTKPLVEEPIFQLPNTVTYIEGTDGTKIYVVGTAHFSEESQNDVIKVKHVIYYESIFCIIILIFRVV